MLLETRRSVVKPLLNKQPMSLLGVDGSVPDVLAVKNVPS
jgi:hypothetical protein